MFAVADPSIRVTEKEPACPMRERRCYSRRGAAVELLTRAVERGPIPCQRIRARAERLGIAWRTLQRARASLGLVTVYRSGSWVWVRP